MDGWMDGWMDRWMNGWIDACMHGWAICVYIYIFILWSVAMHKRVESEQEHSSSDVRNTSKARHVPTGL